MKRLLITLLVGFSFGAFGQQNAAPDNTPEKVNHNAGIAEFGVAGTSMADMDPMLGISFQASNSYYKDMGTYFFPGINVTWARVELMTDDQIDLAVRVNPFQVGFTMLWQGYRPGNTVEFGLKTGINTTFNTDEIIVPGVNLTPEIRYNYQKLSVSVGYDFCAGLVTNDRLDYYQHTARVSVGVRIGDK